MVITNKIELRELAKRKWIRPEAGLLKLQTLDCFSQILPKVGGSRSWRKEPFKKYFEEFQAALFSYGLQQYAPPSYRWEYSYGELPTNRESDCFIRCELLSKDGGLVYKPVQLKELVPENLARNSHDSLQSLLDKLEKKYTARPGEETLVVAIYINRTTTIRFPELKMPKVHIGQLWFYGFTDSRNCFIIGNLLGNSTRRDFAYPRYEIESRVFKTNHDE